MIPIIKKDPRVSHEDVGRLSALIDDVYGPVRKEFEAIYRRLERRNAKSYRKRGGKVGDEGWKSYARIDHEAFENDSELSQAEREESGLQEKVTPKFIEGLRGILVPADKVVIPFHCIIRKADHYQAGNRSELEVDQQRGLKKIVLPVAVRHLKKGEWITVHLSRGVNITDVADFGRAPAYSPLYFFSEEAGVEEGSNGVRRPVDQQEENRYLIRDKFSFEDEEKPLVLEETDQNGITLAMQHFDYSSK